MDFFLQGRDAEFPPVVAASFVFGTGSPDAIGIVVCNLMENQTTFYYDCGLLVGRVGTGIEHENWGFPEWED